MIDRFMLSDIAALCNGELHGPDRAVTRLCTDSRKLQAGDCFVALKGEHFDGNRFVAEAADHGAVAALANSASDALPTVVVADTRLALGLVARENRRRFTGPVIALTGSSGKTSTKEMLAAILRQERNVAATRGNYNNEVGVPLTLMDLATEHDVAVIEMGAAKSGDIAYLCQFACPDIALLTNAQAAHLQGFGSLQGVAETKGEIFTGLPEDGTAIINADDPYLALWQGMAAHCHRTLFSVAGSEAADVRARDIHLQHGLSRFELHCPLGQVSVELALPGRHMVANALAAAGAALAAGASLSSIKAGLESVRGVAGRLSQTQCGGITVINDSYNANPGSVNAAIDVLSVCEGRRILVLGAMAELGGDARELHRDVGRRASQAGIDLVFATGEFAPDLVAAFGAGGQAFADKTTLSAALLAAVAAGDTVLVKGSRSAAMETVAVELETSLSGERH